MTSPAPLLHDATQSAAQAYGATATPEVFVLDRDGIVRYHGAPDGDYDDPTQRGRLGAGGAGRGPRRPGGHPPEHVTGRLLDQVAGGAALVGGLPEPSRGRGAPARPPSTTSARATSLSSAARSAVAPRRRQLGFPGSPTFSVGGRDLFPSEAPAALTCRVYQRADGRSGPLPDGDALAERLRDVLARPWELPGWVDFRATRTAS